MNPYVARAIGALGAVLGLIAIWLDYANSITYWDGEGHAVGIAMLIMAILAGAGIVLASLTQMRALDQLWLLPGLVLGGMAIFLPLSALGAGSLGELKIGGWLGVVSCGLFLIAGIVNALLAAPVAAVATPAPVATTAAPATAAAAVTASAPAGQPEAKPAPETSGPPAGWYPDPTGEARIRYWDGKEWTENTAA